MPGTQRGMPASQLARDYGVSLKDFSNEVIALLARVDGADTAGNSARRREICAAVSATMAIALDTSSLSDEERAKLRPLLHEVLLPFWNSHCAGDARAANLITERSTHYLGRRVMGSQIKTAVNIVTALLDALEIPAERRNELAATLAPSFAHRLVSDIHRINDVRARFGIELSLLATLCALLEMSVPYESILRALRLS
jgi:hypothetical protein